MRKPQSLGNGATFKELSKKTTEAIQIPLPPADEQRRIAAILDHANTVGNSRRLIRTQLDTLTRSVFHHMFGNPQVNSHGLPQATMGSLAEVVTGNSPSRADASNFGRAIEWIKSDNLGGEVASVAGEWLSERGMIRAKIVPPGSVLVTCIAGSRSSIGKASLADRAVSFNQQINAILPTPRLDPSSLIHR